MQLAVSDAAAPSHSTRGKLHDRFDTGTISEGTAASQFID
jgi:hypothetical protein